MTKKLLALSLMLSLVLGGFSGGLEALLSGPFGRSTGLALAQEPPAPPTPSPWGPGLTPGMGAADTRPKKPLTLNEAIEGALANNLDIAIRKLDPQSFRFGVTQQSAAFDPAVDASANYARSQTEPQSLFQSPSTKVRSGDVGISQILKEGLQYRVGWNTTRFQQPGTPSRINPLSDTYNSALSFSITQPLLRNFGFQANTTQLEVSKLDVSTSEEAFRSTVISTLEATEDAYWDLLAALYNYTNQAESLKLANDLLDLNKKKVEVGTLAPIQITEAEASVASREQNVILAEAGIRNAEDNLRRVMNIAPDAPEWDMAIDPTDRPPLEGEAPDLDRMIQEALENRPEIAQAKNQVRTQDLQYRFAHNQRRPQLDAVGSYAPAGNNYTFNPVDLNGNGTIGPKEASHFDVGGFNDSASEVFTTHNYDWNVGVNFSIPIGNRNAKATEARSKIGYEQSQMSLENLERNIQVEVRAAVRAVETFNKSVDAARVNVRLQEKKLDAEQKRYDNGMSTSFQVLTFQGDLTAARSALIAAVAAYIKSIAALGRATATLPETRGVTIAKP